jgi:transposase
MVFSSRAERELYVIKLYQQGKNIREIAKEVHMSFGSIGAVIRSSKGDASSEDKGQREENNLSKAAQALKLFSKGKEPLEVAINLDLGAEEVKRQYREYLQLKGLHRLNSIYDEIGNFLPSFLILFNRMKDGGMMNEKDITSILKSAIELPIIKDRIRELKEKENFLEHQRRTSVANLDNLQNRISSLDDYLSVLANDMNVKIERISDLDNEIANLNGLISDLHKSYEYKKIQKIAEERVSAMLTDAKWVLLAACTAVLETLRNDPFRQELLDSFNYFSSNPPIIMHANFENYLRLYQEKTLAMVKKIFDRLLIKCSEDTMSKLLHP